ncbi:MAG: hypothetical protein OQL19_16060 [Gammaproteobacteria bacterium]|nr:hypothetical protein [Gammaproteobacteria bacterium]
MYNSFFTKPIFMQSFVSMQMFALFLLLSSSVVQAENLKPFYLASSTSGDFAQIVTDTKSKLTAGGFEIIGEYAPYEGANIIVVTNDALKSNAKATKFGGYGAIQRVAVTDVKGSIQVTFTNPVYMANAYRMEGKMEDVASALKNTLGEQESYGSKKGFPGKDLEDYHYMFGMPYFDEPDTLSEHGSYEEAVKTVSAALAEQKGGVSKVFQLELPGKQQTVIGVAMTEADMSNDTTIMKEVDFKDIRATAHLPYEMLIHEDGKVYALSAKFRIAINFPDLSMAGDHSFMGIMASPDAIKKALTLASGGKLETESAGEFDF